MFGVAILVAAVDVGVVLAVVDKATTNKFSFTVLFINNDPPVDVGTAPPARARSQGFGGETVDAMYEGVLRV